jgi:hypothetical protein
MLQLSASPKGFSSMMPPHALNAGARRDHLAFLAEQLELRPLPPAAAIPDLYQPPDEGQ